MAKLVVFNKPYGVLSQFTDADTCNSKKRETLKDYIDIPNIYAAGRLDKDSEGLLLLTADGKLQQRIANPRHKWPKYYWVQVEGDINSAEIDALRDGLELNDGKTLPATVEPISEPENLWQRDPPVRFRKTVPTRWLNVIIREGRNRQVRRMTAAVNHPTLRLIRHRIGPIELGNVKLGQYKVINVDGI